MVRALMTLALVMVGDVLLTLVIVVVVKALVTLALVVVMTLLVLKTHIFAVTEVSSCLSVCLSAVGLSVCLSLSP